MKRNFPLGFIGGLGQPLLEALDEIKAFASDPAHSKELIILKISHTADWTQDDRSALGAEDKRHLVKVIHDRLEGVHNCSFPKDQRLDMLPLQAIVQNGKTVLCLLDPEFDLRADNRGMTYDSDSARRLSFYTDSADAAGQPAGLKSSGQYFLFDEYANSRNPGHVAAHQWGKFKEQMALRREKGVSRTFLLSWTITLQPGPELGDMQSITDCAESLNAELLPTIRNWIARGDIKGAERPNILYVDAYDCRILEAVALINDLPL